jgi:hypothetical protein
MSSTTEYSHHLPTPTLFPPSNVTSLIASPDAVSFGYRFVRWTGIGYQKGHYPALMLTDPIQGNKQALIRVRFLDYSNAQQVKKTDISSPLTTRQLYFLLTAIIDGKKNPYYNMSLENWNASTNTPELPGFTRKFPPSPLGTSNWNKGLAWILDPNSPFDLNTLQTQRISTPSTVPHNCLIRFTECAVLLLTFIDTAPPESFTEDEVWTLRTLFYAFPALILKAPERLSFYAKLRLINGRCDRFLAGDWQNLWKGALTNTPPRRPHFFGPPTEEDNLLRADFLTRSGAFGTAHRILTSEGLSTKPTTEIRASLRALHPNHDSPCIPMSLLQPPPLQDLREAFGYKDDDNEQTFSQIPLRSATIVSSPLSSPDILGWRPRENFNQLMYNSDSFAKLFIDVILIPLAQGKIPLRLKPIFAGGILFALSKGAKPGVRPVGNGVWFRKLLARLLLMGTDTRKKLANFFLSTYTNYKQLAISVPSGVEKTFATITLAAGIIPSPTTQTKDLDLSDEVQCVIQSDIINAFNEVNRQIFFDSLAGKASQSYPGCFIEKGDVLLPPPIQHAFAFLASLYGGPAKYTHYDKDGSSPEIIINSAGFHQGCPFGSFGFALSTFHTLGRVLAQDLAVLGMSIADNNCLTGPLKNAWAMLDRIRIAYHSLGLRLNPNQSFLWVPAWSYLPVPPAALLRTQATFPLSTLQYCPEGFPFLGLPLGTREYAHTFLGSVANKIATTLEPISHIHDGRVFTTMMRSCVNLRPLYYLRNLPSELTNEFAFSCDQAFMSTITSYYCFPMDWFTDEQHLRAVAQMRSSIRQGGLGLTAAQSLVHSSFYAGFSHALALIGSSTLHPYVKRDFLSVTQPGSSEHSFLRNYHLSRNTLGLCGAYKTEEINNLTPEKAVILPSAEELFPTQITPSTDLPRIPSQKCLSDLIKANHPDFKTLNSPNPHDRARIQHLSTITCSAHSEPGSPSEILDPLLKGDTTELTASANSWVAVVPGSKIHDAFPRHQFVAFIHLLLGIPQAKSPHSHTICACLTPIDPDGHHTLTCKTWVGNSAIRGHDLVVHSLEDIARTTGLSCSSNTRTVPTHRNTNHRGDIIFGIAGRLFSDMVGDVSIAHMAVGNPSDITQGTIGTWKASALTQRFSSKRKKHQEAYSNQDLLFLPLVVSTYGVLHQDFLRLLWIIADKSARPTNIGEVRTGPICQTPRMIAFHKFVARISIAAAKAAVMRMLGISGSVHYVSPTSTHCPSDPTLLLHSSVAGTPIGP